MWFFTSLCFCGVIQLDDGGGIVPPIDVGTQQVLMWICPCVSAACMFLCVILPWISFPWFRISIRWISFPGRMTNCVALGFSLHKKHLFPIFSIVSLHIKKMVCFSHPFQKFPANFPVPGHQDGSHVKLANMRSSQSSPALQQSAAEVMQAQRGGWCHVGDVGDVGNAKKNKKHVSFFLFSRGSPVFFSVFPSFFFGGGVQFGPIKKIEMQNKHKETKRRKKQIKSPPLFKVEPKEPPQKKGVCC